MTAKKMTRKERERQAHKQEVLDIALDLFAEKGFYSVSMQEIAEMAEYSVGTLYNLFENKDSLFDELMNSTRSRIREELSAVLDTPGDAVQRVRTFICSQPDLLEQYATFIKVYVTELGKRGAKASRQDDDDLNVLINTKLSEILAAGISQGLFRPVDPLITAQALGAVIETLALEMATHFDKENAVDKFAKVEQLFVDGLLTVKGDLNVS